MIKATSFFSKICMSAGIFLYLQAITSIRATAQNLIPNPSFELMNACPTGWHEGFPFVSNGSGTFARDWYMANGGTSDYFNACAPAMPTSPLDLFVSTPFQLSDYQVP